MSGGLISELDTHECANCGYHGATLDTAAQTLEQVLWVLKNAMPADEVDEIDFRRIRDALIKVISGTD